jgi:hypothetical protein
MLPVMYDAFDMFGKPLTPNKQTKRHFLQPWRNNYATHKSTSTNNQLCRCRVVFEQNITRGSAHFGAAKWPKTGTCDKWLKQQQCHQHRQ